MRIYKPNFSKSQKIKHFAKDTLQGLVNILPWKKKEKLKIIYYYHVPKCGGNYTLATMKLIQNQLRCEFISFTLLKNQSKPPDAAEKQIKFIQSLKNYSKGSVLLIHHHHGYPGMEDLHEHLLQAKKDVTAKGGEMIIFTIVREPVTHMISAVNYLRKWPETVMTFKERIDDPGFKDVMTRYFLYNESERWLKLDHKGYVEEALLKKNIKLFDKIFISERMDSMTSYVNSLLGTDVEIKKKVNVSKKEVMPTEEEIKRFLDGIYWDKYFYNLAKEKGPDTQDMLAEESSLIQPE